MAFAGPTIRCSDQDVPESQDRAIPANARLNPAVSTSTRKSAASANPAPAPAATPLTAAMTGLFIVASSSTTGL